MNKVSELCDEGCSAYDEVQVALTEALKFLVAI